MFSLGWPCDDLVTSASSVYPAFATHKPECRISVGGMDVVKKKGEKKLVLQENFDDFG